MTMRPCTPAPLLCLAAAATALLGGSAPEAAASAPAPACGAAADDASAAFPLTTRLHGGPDTYRAGGGPGTWYLDLTNTTRLPCVGVHPVVVLVDEARALRPSQPRLEFYAPDGSPRPVRFDTTDEDELVGAFTATPQAPFPGFTVPAGRTLTVRLRLSLTSDAVANDITANAAVVQRHGDDGDWVGQSNDYRFTVESAAPGPAGDATAASSPPGAGDRPDPDASPETSPDASPGPSLADEAKELARSGLTSTAGLVAATACLLAAGTAILLARRRD